MSFTGDLEHLPIVDVIQLLHSTRKTGTLCVKSARGESQLVFDSGYISSANHVNTSVRIGQILVDIEAISQEVCDQALAAQKAAGDSRKPLIAMLIEQGVLSKEDAFRGLRMLIEKTVVEMLRWTKGTFTLDVKATGISDEYRYFPDMLHQEIHLDTQGVLMEALRIFDEKNYEGDFEEEEWDNADSAEAVEAVSEETSSVDLSADDLGLGDLDQLERKIPEVFASIKVIDPAEGHRQRLSKLSPGMDAESLEALVAFLTPFSQEDANAKPVPATGKAERSLIFFSLDAVIRHAVMTLCKAEGILIFTTDDQEDLELILAQSLQKGMVPLLVLGCPDETVAAWTGASLSQLRQRLASDYPQLQLVQLAPAASDDFMLQAYQDGVRAVLPRPCGLTAGGGAGDLIRFFELLLQYLKNYFSSQKQLSLHELKGELVRLQALRDAPELSLLLLQRVAGFFERALTFIIRSGEMIAERGIGLKQEDGRTPTPPLKFRVPLDKPSIVHKALAEGKLFFGPSGDAVLRDYLYTQIGSPQNGSILLLPICNQGRPIALIYGDCGAGGTVPVPLDALEILAGQAGLVLENALIRRQLEKYVAQG